MATYIDLTHTYKPGFPGFEQEPAKQIDKDGWNASTYHIYSHSGTHMDAPVHFGVSDRSIEQIPIERLICYCHIVDITDIDPGGLIKMDHLHDVIPFLKPNEGLIFHSNWSRFVGDSNMWRNHLPRISKELAEWLVKNNVKMVGVEPPSVADVNNIEELTEIHKILLDGDVIIIEGLTNLDQLRENFVKIIALPLKVLNGDGAPCRVIAEVTDG